MRILFVSNFYPPFELGGWEQLTQEISQRLEKRGHTTTVLTSRHGARKMTTPEPGVHRWLHLESEDIFHYHPTTWFTKTKHERANWRYLEKAITKFQPDTIFFHSMWNLPRSLAWYAEQLMPGRVIYYVAGPWPYAPNAHEAYWQAPAHRTWLRWPKRIAAAIPLALLRIHRMAHPIAFEHVLCVSNAVRQGLARSGGIPFSHSSVIYNGIDTHQFSPPSDWYPATWKNGAPALLYAGSLIRVKGVHTAIEGFAKAAQQLKDIGLTLTIVGSGDAAYTDYLKQLAHENGMMDLICFLGRVERSQMPDLLRKFDIFIFPSSWDEPLARMMQEAMACGLVVIGTTTGGSKELLSEGETGLTFEAENSDSLAQQIKRAVSDPDLRCRLAQAGQQAAVERFGLERMIDEIETYLESALTGSPSI